ncbi:16S rRNA (guanine(966)-N(2))-methyltransferase RsmD [Microbacterium sp. SORGH_AS_0888]|uniref:16S rRNA (guanine(966)-N(2))-methyltransferase RsmD n=1 Tax=Microbacterium sp. SORGH_AS_0888 TaxID=3041791 RepID=UPI002784FC07|nr:16S rRNA (guanine(966)-N(2))-methyltransferase RsmD [Microbacterium sp. SORGH_AS_0888]MDQ1128378.1 16S rRNA (guanine966-N2)-methyltransferase [Microbacterium sp. SORGH_AS_0888]
MTRIISGRAGGIRLDVPARGTRPTSDRVRESMFGALESADAIDGARVLDLYAGSGALGLEALSRGAASADLVERSADAARVAERNAARLASSLGTRARVHRGAVQAFLARATPGEYDLVFTDPPYDLADADMLADLALLRPALSIDALVVVERARRSLEPAWEDAALEPVRERVYGDTIVWWAQPLTASQSE